MSNDSFVVRADGLPHIDKDPDASVIYTWDWSSWLAKSGATTIESAVTTAEAGITKVGDPVIEGAYVTQKMSGGTIGASYKVACKITTGVPVQTDERTIVIDVKER